MADLPVPALSGKTPLQVAEKPNMDRIAREGLSGLVSTVPAGMAPGSDTANMAVMGYDPKRFYTGRSPIEAVSMSIEMEPGDIAFRCNLVTMTDEPTYADRTMVDHGKYAAAVSWSHQPYEIGAPSTVEASSATTPSTIRRGR